MMQVSHRHIEIEIEHGLRNEWWTYRFAADVGADLGFLRRPCAMFLNVCGDCVMEYIEHCQQKELEEVLAEENRLSLIRSRVRALIGWMNGRCRLRWFPLFRTGWD